MGGIFDMSAKNNRLDSPLSWALAYAAIAASTFLLITVPATLLFDDPPGERLIVTLVGGAMAGGIGMVLGLLQLGLVSGLSRRPLWQVLLVMMGLGALGGIAVTGIAAAPIAAVNPNAPQPLSELFVLVTWTHFFAMDRFENWAGWAALMGVLAASWVWIPFLLSRGRGGKRLLSVVAGMVALPIIFWVWFALRRMV
jgi:hypothetical protein